MFKFKGSNIVVIVCVPFSPAGFSTAVSTLGVRFREKLSHSMGDSIGRGAVLFLRTNAFKMLFPSVIPRKMCILKKYIIFLKLLHYNMQHLPLRGSLIKASS